MTRASLAGALLGLSSLITLGGCSDGDGLAPDEHLSEAESWIINGVPDTTHQAVVALFGASSACTGTIIGTSGTSAFVLTAAHCFGPGPIQQVAIGDNYQYASAVLNVIDYQIHPQYDAQDLVFDFAMIRANGASATTPVIPALTQPDDLAVGRQLTHVGYGLLSYPNGDTSERHRATGQIAELGAIYLAYNQPTSGPCLGDSGGPNLVDTPSGERVAGVVSFGDETCSQAGYSGRVSYVYNYFIAPFMGVGGSSSSSSSSSSGTGATGGAGGGTGAGTTGGADPTDGWIAGDTDRQDISGTIVSSCATGEGEDAPGAGWLLWLLGAVGLWRFRRS